MTVAEIRRSEWPRSYPLVQFPNAPLAVALAAGIAARFVDGRAHGFASAISSACLAIFAYLELTAGVNAFRRVLGAVVLASVILRLGDQL